MENSRIHVELKYEYVLFSGDYDYEDMTAFSLDPRMCQSKASSLSEAKRLMQVYSLYQLTMISFKLYVVGYSLPFDTSHFVLLGDILNCFQTLGRSKLAYSEPKICPAKFKLWYN